MKTQKNKASGEIERGGRAACLPCPALPFCRCCMKRRNLLCRIPAWTQPRTRRSTAREGIEDISSPLLSLTAAVCNAGRRRRYQKRFCGEGRA
ncbi:hypothetical protein LX32DRAFT_435644 [Colletotrichum zoysiae]|uniref:Uncharacterized protein n=1 Tax=Colletotrichum zoysiae TaxID=1216348 RepID=A0AAD9M387_9PEZI|nr:hypothetical protein LX32DRAFT_435644 [Colletotrichum zoysiae]